MSALSLRVLQHPEGNATVTDLSGGERRVSVSPRDPALFIRVRECTTRYPDDLIETVLAVKGIGALCDEIEREELPAALGRFDVIVFSAVFEHLLARERAVVIPQVWSVLAPGGVLLVGETPHRWTPVELHTTGGLPLVNYLPAPLALRIARRFSPRVRAGASWPELLRAGIRGGTERQFLAILRRGAPGSGPGDAVLRRPAGRAGLRDEFDLWYAISAANELPGVKARLRDAFRVLERLTGVSFTPYLSFAIEKARRP